MYVKAHFLWKVFNPNQFHRCTSSSIFTPLLLRALFLASFFLCLHSSSICPICCSRHTSSEGAVSAGDRGWRRGTHAPRSVHRAGRNLPQGGRGRRMERDSQVRRRSRPHGLGLASCCVFSSVAPESLILVFYHGAVVMAPYLSGCPQFTASLLSVHCLTSP